MELTFHGTCAQIYNIYVPTDRPTREALLDFLATQPIATGIPVSIGGDFNCCLYGLVDRSYHRAGNAHGSSALRRLLDAWDCSDVLEQGIQEALDDRTYAEFWATHHTYGYTLPDGNHATGRLDRWYVQRSYANWVRAVRQSVPRPPSDRNGVGIRTADADRIVMVKQIPENLPS